MIKKKIKKIHNVINFPTKLSSVEKEIEAIVFAAAEPLNIETIENKISKKTNVEKIQYQQNKQKISTNLAETEKKKQLAKEKKQQNQKIKELKELANKKLKYKINAVEEIDSLIINGTI